LTHSGSGGPIVLRWFSNPAPARFEFINPARSGSGWIWKIGIRYIPITCFVTNGDNICLTAELMIAIAHVPYVCTYVCVGRWSEKVSSNARLSTFTQQTIIIIIFIFISCGCWWWWWDWVTVAEDVGNSVFCWRQHHTTSPGQLLLHVLSSSMYLLQLKTYF